MEDQSENGSQAQSEENGPDKERRQVRRIAIAVMRTVLSEISGIGEMGEKQFYLYINDISEKGMRFTTDIFIPEENKVKLRLFLDSPLELDARTVWAKEIGKGNYVMGLEFTGDSEVNGRNIPRLINWARPPEDIRSLFLHTSLNFEGLFRESKRKFFAHVIVINPEGIELTCDFPFPLAQEFSLTFTINEKIAPLTVNGKVVFQKEIISPGAVDCPIKIYKTWIEFVDPPSVERHIQEVRAAQ